MTKVKVEVKFTLKKSTDSDIFLGNIPFWEETMDDGDSKGRVINKKHTILGESDLICL